MPPCIHLNADGPSWGSFRIPFCSMMFSNVSFTLCKPFLCRVNALLQLRCQYFPSSFYPQVTVCCWVFASTLHFTYTKFNISLSPSKASLLSRFPLFLPEPLPFPRLPHVKLWHGQPRCTPCFCPGLPLSIPLQCTLSLISLKCLLIDSLFHSANARPTSFQALC